MGWNEPQTWVDGVSIVDADTLNRQVRDNLRELAPATGWSFPALLNGWANYDAARPARYRKDAGVVSIGGLIKAGTVSTATTGNAFTLPPGFRPQYQLFLGVIVAGGALGVVEIYPTGDVRCEVGANGYFALDDLRPFRAA